jgi:hypothetical protein
MVKPPLPLTDTSPLTVSVLAVAAVDTTTVPLPLTVRLPPTVVGVAPSVVVPALTVRSLKEVKMADGRVLFAVSSTVPVPGVQTAPAPEVVMAPPTLSVPPAVMSMVLICVATAPRARLPQTRVDPLVKVMVPTLFALAPPTVTAPDTVSLGLPDAANVSVAVPEPPGLTDRLVQTALGVSTITV